MRDERYDIAQIPAGNLEIFIGGDFNTHPLEREPDNPYPARRIVAPLAAVDQGNWINTTNVNPYDYWYISDGLLVADRCRVWADTRMPGLSDHAGISLEY